MNDQVTPAVEVRRRSNAPWIIIALVIILAGVLVWFLTSKGVPEGDPSTFLPKDCIVAMTFDLRDSPEKRAAMGVAEGVFKDAGIDDPEAWLLDKLKEETKVDFGKEVLPRLSRTGGFAVLAPPAAGKMEPDVVAVVGANSESDAAYLVKLLVDAQKKKGKTVAEGNFEGVKYFKYAEGSSTTCVGAVKSVMVVASAESAFQKGCNTIKGTEASLDEQGAYTGLREVKPSTFATFYLSGENIYNAFMKPQMAQAPPDLAKQMEDTYKSLQVVAMGDANGDGITSRLKMRSNQKGALPKSVSLDDLAAMCPEDAAFAMSMVGISESVAQAKEQYLNSESMKPQVDQAVQMMKMSTGIDLFADLLDRIDGFAMYFVPRKTSNPVRDMPGHFVFVLTVDKPSVIQGTIGKLKTAMAGMGGMTLPEMQIAGQTVTIIPAGPGGPKMGLTMVGNKVIFGLTQSDLKDALTGAIRLAQKKGSTLASSGEFKMVKDRLPAQSPVMVFMNAEPILDLFRGEMEAEDKKIADAITKRVSAVGVAGEGSGSDAVIDAVMPFKK